MARIAITSTADADSAEILRRLDRKAGAHVADRFPNSGASP